MTNRYSSEFGDVSTVPGGESARRDHTDDHSAMDEKNLTNDNIIENQKMEPSESTCFDDDVRF